MPDDDDEVLELGPPQPAYWINVPKGDRIGRPVDRIGNLGWEKLERGQSHAATLANVQAALQAAQAAQNKGKKK